MSNELMKIEFQPEQIQLIKKQIAPNATDNELKLFLYQAQRTGLDPLTRQIYCIHRGGKMTVQTSIDGFRVIAERSGDYAGQDEPIFNEWDGKLVSCKVTVYRFKGEIRYPAAVGVAFMSEYNAGGNMWIKMPHTMLSKCAEAVALRKAYPQDLSGLYTNDEMNQADSKADVTIPAQALDEYANDGPGVAAAFDTPDSGERQLLIDLVYNSTLTESQKEKYLSEIPTVSNYKRYEKIKYGLENCQKEFENVTNPSAKDINKRIKAITG